MVSNPKMPELYKKRHNWLKYASYLSDSKEDRYMKDLVREWFDCDEYLTYGGFSCHYTGDISQLPQHPFPLPKSVRDKTLILEDILRRCKEGTMMKVPKERLRNIIPLFMLSKYKKISQPELGEKHRLIFNHSTDTKYGKGINHNIPDDKRKIQYPRIIPRIIEVTEKVYKTSHNVWMGCMDVQNGFEHLFCDQFTQSLQGVHALGDYYMSLVATYGDASRPFQMHNLLKILVKLIEIYLKIELDICMDLNAFTIKYMDDLGLFGPSKDMVNQMIDYVTKIGWKVFGIPFKEVKTVRATKHLKKFLGYELDFRHKAKSHYYISPARDTIDKLVYRAKVIIKDATFPLRTITAWLGSAYNIAYLKYPLKSMCRAIEIIHQNYLLTHDYADIVVHNSQLSLLINTVTIQLKDMTPMTLDKYKFIDFSHTWLKNQPDFTWYSDASDWGYGLIDTDKGVYCAEAWPKGYKDRIDVREALAPLAYLRSYGHKYRNKMIHLWIDNKPVMHGIIKKRYSYIKVDIIIHEIFKECMKYDILMRVDYINTKDNKLADYLSRKRMDLFHEEIQKQNIKLNNYMTRLPLYIPNYNIFSLFEN